MTNSNNDARLLSLIESYQAEVNYYTQLIEMYKCWKDTDEVERLTKMRGQREKHLEKLQERIARLCAKESGDDQQAAERLSEIRIEDGAPAKVVLEVAKEIDADLIIMGSHRHTVIGDAMLGTTTHKVLHSTETPVLVVRIPDGFHEEGF